MTELASSKSFLGWAVIRISMQGITTGTVGTVTGQRFSYSVKVINPVKKSEYVVHKLRITGIFKSVDEIKENIVSTVQGLTSVIDQVGYIEPGHGAKGRQRWLSASEDLKDMYLQRQKKLEILFWCYKEVPSSRAAGSK